MLMPTMLMRQDMGTKGEQPKNPWWYKTIFRLTAHQRQSQSHAQPPGNLRTLRPPHGHGGRAGGGGGGAGVGCGVLGGDVSRSGWPGARRRRRPASGPRSGLRLPATRRRICFVVCPRCRAAAAAIFPVKGRRCACWCHRTLGARAKTSSSVFALTSSDPSTPPSLIITLLYDPW